MDSPDNILKKLKLSSYKFNIVCPYCNKHTELVDGTTIYPHRYDLRHKQFYLCKACNAYCGCHGNTTQPLGTPANAQLRKARIDAHNAFDALWKDIYNEMSDVKNNRKNAYIKLAAQMKLQLKDTHIGQFNLEQCKQVQEIVKTCNGH